MELVSRILRSSLSLSVLPTVPQSHPEKAMWCFFFQLIVSSFSLKISNSCLRLLLRLFVPSIFPSTTCFRRQFLRKTWPIELAFLLFIWRSFLPWLYSILLRSSHDWSRCLLHPSARPHFTTFKVLAIRFPKSDFQHHIKICYKCNISLESLTISCQTACGEFRKSNYEIWRSNLREQEDPNAATNQVQA
jgi:hypothetical protein